MAGAHNIPNPKFDNLFLADPLGEAFWSFLIGEDHFASVRHQFVTMGAVGAQAEPLAARADRDRPRLITHDLLGERVDRIEYHPDYLRMEEMVFGSGVVALKFEEAFLQAHRERRHLVGFGSGYYFAQTEIGLFCPITMTDGVGRVLERFGEESLARETIAHLSSRNRENIWQGAMFLTERQGGSDVGANEVTARQEGESWFLCGDKWFCSNVDAEAILVLARMPKAPQGTSGLGLFLLLRHKPPGNGATIRIHRLKEKMGVRSMPTGEVTLQDSQAFLIGGAGEGFKQMAEMLNHSRLFTALGSVAAMRRALLEALAYGWERRAFGSTLWQHPLWRSGMADLVAEHLGALLLTFEAVRSLDQADCGDQEAEALARILIPMAKAVTGKLGVFCVSEAMEAIGGNAYIEESIMPRLLRDVQVLPIWEGTTNILALDVQRAVEKKRSHETLLSRGARALAAAQAGGQGLERECTAIARDFQHVGEELHRLRAQSPADVQRGSREWLEKTARVFTRSLLLEMTAHPPLKEPAMAAFRRIAQRPWGTTPLSATDPIPLEPTEEVLLRAGYNPV